MFTNFTLTTLHDGKLFSFGMDRHDFLIIFIALVMIFMIGIWQERGISLRAQIAAKPILFRYAVYYTLILAIVIFGAYGAGYVPVDPIYASF